MDGKWLMAGAVLGAMTLAACHDNSAGTNQGNNANGVTTPTTTANGTVKTTNPPHSNPFPQHATTSGTGGAGGAGTSGSGTR